MKSISTIERPLYFFYKFFNIKTLYDERIEIFIDDSEITSVPKQNKQLPLEETNISEKPTKSEDCDICCHIPDETINDYIHSQRPTFSSTSIEDVIEINYLIENKITLEISESKSLILKNIANSKEPKIYLNNIISELNTIKNKSKNFLSEKYPFMVKMIDNALNDLIIDIIKELNPSETIDVNTEKQKIVDEIFSCLRDYDYISVSEYKRFIGYLYQFVEKYTVPTVNPKFHKFKNSVKNLPDTILFHLFYKLYRKLDNKYYIRGKQRFFGAFIVESFIHLNSRDVNEITNKLSTNANPDIKKTSSYFPEY